MDSRPERVPPGSPFESGGAADPRLRRLRDLVRLLDSAVQIPGTDWRIGLDGIIGLIPGLGDVVTTVMSAWIIREARLLGVRKHTRVRMGWNLALDFVVGALPLAGDLFDMAWKANVRNLRLIERDLAKQARDRAK